MEISANSRDKSGSTLERSYTRKGPGIMPHRRKPYPARRSQYSLSAASIRVYDTYAEHDARTRIRLEQP